MSSPLPILYLATSGQVGGAERCLMSLIGGLDATRFAANVIIGSPGPLAAMLVAQGAKAEVEALPSGLRRLSQYHASAGAWAKWAPAWQAPGYLWNLRRAGMRIHPQLVHSNGVKMHYLSAVLKSSWGAPLIWHLHDFPARARDGREPWANHLLQRLSRRPDLVIANSKAVAEAYGARFPRLQPKLRVVPNGVSVEEMQRARATGQGAALRQRWGLQTEDFVVGMVAIFAPWKGQEVFLQAARQIHQQAPEVRFVLVGDDIYDTAGHGGRREELEGLARELGLADVVHFTGFLGSEVPAAFAALDIMVHASTEPEPFGRTVIEAMAAGTPVIAAAAGGMLEIVQDGVSGRLTSPSDVDALVAAILQLRGNRELRRRLADEGLNRVRQHFSEEAVGQTIMALYAELLAGVSAS